MLIYVVSVDVVALETEILFFSQKNVIFLFVDFIMTLSSCL